MILKHLKKICESKIARNCIARLSFEKFDADVLIFSQEEAR